MVATGLPFIESEKYCLLTSVHGGIGKDLDPFSVFRLPRRPTGYEWEAISLPMIHGVAFNELFPTRYAVANFLYRYEALFFLYPYLEATWRLGERLVFTSNDAAKNMTDSMPALGGGLVTGAPWKLQVELNYTYNFGTY